MGTTEPISGAVLEGTLSGQPGGSLIQNPPFDARILQIPVLNSAALAAGGSGAGSVNQQGTTTNTGYLDSSLYRGMMASRVTPGQSTQYKVNFLYNPSTIQESRSLDLNNQILPSYARNPDDPSQYVTGLNATVSFDLLFDRTFELWDSQYVNTQVGTYGAMVDVNAFYNMLNINQLNTTNGPMNIGGPTGGLQKVLPPVVGPNGRSTQTFSMVVQGAMSAIPVDLYFGYQSIGALSYFGYVTDMTITYTSFTQQMVPKRLAIGIDFQVMSENFNTTTTG